MTKEMAQTLANAWKNREALTMASLEGQLNNFEEAYAVQHQVVALKGQPTGGYKISLTSEGTQKMFNTNEPLYGELCQSQFLKAPTTINLAEMNEPLIEVELAMIAKTDLEAGLSDEELLKSVEISADIEVPDARFQKWFPALHKYLVCADCAVGGYIITGETVDGASLTVESLNQIHAKVTRDGEVIREGDSTEVLDNPIHALQWLLNKLKSEGRGLKAGQIVSTGTFFVPPALAAGEYVVELTGAINQTLKLSVK